MYRGDETGVGVCRGCRGRVRGSAGVGVCRGSRVPRESQGFNRGSVCVEGVEGESGVQQGSVCVEGVEVEGQGLKQGSGWTQMDTTRL